MLANQCQVDRSFVRSLVTLGANQGGRERVEQRTTINEQNEDKEGGQQRPR